MDKTICVAEVDRGTGVSKMCTVVSYSGPDARQVCVHPFEIVVLCSPNLKAFLKEYRGRVKLAL